MVRTNKLKPYQEVTLVAESMLNGATEIVEVSSDLFVT
jgi:hypothetical protein